MKHRCQKHPLKSCKALASYRAFFGTYGGGWFTCEEHLGTVVEEVVGRVGPDISEPMSIQIYRLEVPGERSTMKHVLRGHIKPLKEKRT